MTEEEWSGQSTVLHLPLCLKARRSISLPLSDGATDAGRTVWECGRFWDKVDWTNMDSDCLRSAGIALEQPEA